MRKFKKMLSLIMVGAVTASTIPLTAMSVNAAKTDSEEVSSITQKLDDFGRAVYYDDNGKEIPIETLNDDNSENKSYPSKYDLRDYNRITSVKDQGEQGYCWAFASAASIESNILTNPKLSKKIGESPADNLDLSKTGTAWFIMTGIQDESSPYYNDYYYDDYKGSNGGWPSIIALGLNCGFGTYPEELAPYSKALSGYSEYFRYYSDYHLKDFNMLSNDIDVIKDNIINNGAIALYYFSADSGYSSDNTAYCDNYEVAQTTRQPHVVTIAGWDDNYSRDNFNGAVKPENDGAWLCKNSWGESSQDNGYFWLSYESYGLQFNQFIMQDNSEYDNEYQHGFSFSDGWAGMSISENANVFTANSDEEITQVSFGSMGAYNYEISVYKLNDNFTSPVDGNLLATTSGKVDNVGIHYIDLPNSAFVESGDTFSVVVKGDENNYITFDSNTEKQHVPRKGYFKSNGKWEDSVNCDFGYSSIKAFTKNIDNSNVKSLLESAINKAENMEISTDVDQKFVDELKSQINAGKKLLNTENVCAGDINNAIYLLNYRISAVADAVYNINSMDDFTALSKKIYNNEIQPSKIILNTDLDFENNLIKPLSGFDGTFSGEFIGNGHTIKNAEIDSILTMTYDSIQGFFGVLNNAKIKDLNFENITCTGNRFSGIVSSKADSAVIDNVKVNNCAIKMNSDYECQQVAGICPTMSNSTVTNCKVENSKFYGNIVYELVNAFNINCSNNSASNNEIHSYGSIYMYNSATDSNRTFEVTFTDINDNVILEKSKDDTVRFRKFSDKKTTIYDESVSYTKQGEWYYVNLEKSSDYVLVMLIPDEEVVNTEYQYSVDFDTYNALLKRVNLDSYISEVTLPAKINGQTVYATTPNFKFDSDYAYNISAITVPDSYIKLGKNIFDEMQNLKKVKLGNGIKKIEDYWFEYKNISSIELGNSIEEIGNGAFRGCQLLEDIVIPDSVKKIGDNAFQDISFNKITFGKNVSEIGEYAFGYSGRTIPCENDRYAKLPNAVINGYAGTAAEEYAKNNEFSFNNLDENEPDMNQEYYPSYSIQAGDIDFDGEITIKDATLLQKYIVKSEPLNDFQLAAASVKDAPNTLTIINATSVQKYVAKLYDSLEPSDSKG